MGKPPHMLEPRVAPLTDPTPEQRALITTGMERDHEFLNIFATFARVPWLFKRIRPVGHLLLWRSSFSPRIREIVIIRTAWRTRSVYEFGQHREIGRESDLDDDEINALARNEVGDLFTDEERLFISAVDEMHAADRITDVTWEALSQSYTAENLIELTLLIGLYRMLGGFLNSAGVQLEVGVDGWADDAEDPA